MVCNFPGYETTPSAKNITFFVEEVVFVLKE